MKSSGRTGLTVFLRLERYTSESHSLNFDVRRLGKYSAVTVSQQCVLTTLYVLPITFYIPFQLLKILSISIEAFYSPRNTMISKR